MTEERKSEILDAFGKLGTIPLMFALLAGILWIDYKKTTQETEAILKLVEDYGVEQQEILRTHSAEQTALLDSLAGNTSAIKEAIGELTEAVDKARFVKQQELRNP